jgi:hypothetical protein
MPIPGTRRRSFEFSQVRRRMRVQFQMVHSVSSTVVKVVNITTYLTASGHPIASLPLQRVAKWGPTKLGNSKQLNSIA